MSGKKIDELYKKLEKIFEIDKKKEFEGGWDPYDYFYEIKKRINRIVKNEVEEYFITTEKHPEFLQIVIDVYILTNTHLFNFSIEKDSYRVNFIQLKNLLSPSIKVNKDVVDVELLSIGNMIIVFRDKKENMEKIIDFVSLITYPK